MFSYILLSSDIQSPGNLGKGACFDSDVQSTGNLGGSVRLGSVTIPPSPPHALHPLSRTFSFLAGDQLVVRGG